MRRWNSGVFTAITYSNSYLFSACSFETFTTTERINHFISVIKSSFHFNIFNDYVFFKKLKERHCLKGIFEIHASLMFLMLTFLRKQYLNKDSALEYIEEAYTLHFWCSWNMKNNLVGRNVSLPSLNLTKTYHLNRELCLIVKLQH